MTKRKMAASEELRQALGAAGIGISELAQIAGIDRATAGKALAGKPIGFGNYAALLLAVKGAVAVRRTRLDRAAEAAHLEFVSLVEGPADEATKGDAR
jgi:hypothetical protein